VTVQCPSCGELVDIPSFPGWCPQCNNRIATLVPPLTSQRGRGSSSPSSRSRGSGFPTEPEPETPLPYIEPRRAPQMNWVKGAKIAALILGFLIAAFVLVDYVALKARNLVSKHFPANKATPTSTTPSAASEPPKPTEEPIQPLLSPHDSGPVASAGTPPSGSPQRPTTTPVAPAMLFAPALEPKRYVDPAGTVTDKAINDAITRGVTFVISTVESPTTKPSAGDSADQMEGRFALCVLALLHAGQSTYDPRLAMNGELMPDLIERMKRLPMIEGRVTYARACRALALAVHNRKIDRTALNADLDWLLKAAVNGSYHYTAPKTKEERVGRPFDNSNTQYGVLGVWAAADAGLSVPPQYWEDVEAHWSQTQLPDGGWAYQATGAPLQTMTAGGLTSLLVAGDMLSSLRISEGVDRAPFRPAVQRALDWLATGDNSVTLSGHEGYALYGLERAGLASGFKRFGKHDWYRELSARVLSTQAEDGTWNGNDGLRPETCFRILFLARGRHPVMMNKLRFDGPWANRPRDLAKLSDFVYDSIERPVNWQVVNLSEGWADWMDSPVLYLASHDPVELSDDHVKHLRTYCDSGGLLFTNADADSAAFTSFVNDLAKRMYPQYEMRDLPPDHAIYSMVYKMTSKNNPPMRGLSNGTRMLIIHSPTDLASRWQNTHPRSKPAAYQMGANLYVYATGKQVPRNRLDTPIVPDTPGNAIGSFSIARVKHAGDWDPEPAAWGRMARWFRRETSIALNVVPTELSKLNRNTTPFAHLTARASWKPSEAELQAIRTFVREGGLLFLDPCGGAPDVAGALQRDIAQAAFPDVAPRDASDKDQFIAGTGDGMDEIVKPTARVYAVEMLENKVPPLQVIGVGKGWIVVSKLDVVTALLGTSTWGIMGYDYAYAQSLMKNLILVACNGRTVVAPASAPAAPAPSPTGESLNTAGG